MRTFRVDADAFFASSHTAYSSDESRERCREPMRQLIERYDLAGKSVVSVGPSGAHEEYWLHEAGSPLTLVDLDEDDTIAPTLATLPEADGPTRALTYVIGDAFEWGASQAEPADALYMSGFTPEEVRRHELVTADADGGATRVRRKLVGGVNLVASRTIGRRVLRGVPSWPADALPFTEETGAMVRGIVRPGGLFVCQSYAARVDVLDNPHLIELQRRQLADWGFQQLDVYAFTPWFSAVTLTIALRGTPQDADEFRRRIASKPELTEFHGRSDSPHAVSRVG